MHDPKRLLAIISVYQYEREAIRHISNIISDARLGLMVTGELKKMTDKLTTKLWEDDL